jgi:hypothetical protein
MTEHDIWLGPGAIASLLGVDPKTVARIADLPEGGFGRDNVRHTPKGHRRIRLSAAQAYLAAKTAEVAA